MVDEIDDFGLPRKGELSVKELGPFERRERSGWFRATLLLERSRVLLYMGYMVPSRPSEQMFSRRGDDSASG